MKLKNMWKLLSVTIAVVFLLGGFAACAKSEVPAANGTASGRKPVAEFEMIYSTQEVDATTEKCLRIFTDLVNAGGQGRINLTSYYKAELGAVREQLDGVMANTINMTSQPSGQLITFVPWTSVASDLPFAWTDWNAMFQWHEQIWIPEVNKDLAAQNMMLLPSVGSEGTSGIYSAVGPIHSPADLKGKTFRAMAPGIETMWMEALGAKPQVLPWAELYTSMESGLIDLQHNPAVYLIDYGFYEVCHDFTVTEHKKWTYIGMCNLDWWNSLPEDIQGVVADAWKASAAAMKWYSWKLNAEYLEKLQQPPYNVNVYYPTTEEMAQFKAAMSSVYDWARTEYGDDKVDMMLDYAK